MNKNRVNPLVLFGIIFGLSILSIFVFAKANKVEEIEEEIEEVKEVVNIPEVATSIIDNTNKDTIYLAKGDHFQLDYSLKTNKNTSSKSLNYSSDNPECVYVSMDGRIDGIDNGEATITISADNISKTVHVISTDLILPRHNDKLYSKPYLKCGEISEEENDLLDAILKDRIDSAGYQTRAGVVEAVRFLLFELPYRINYFFENGRVNAVDGEGRYYHEGLYLNSSRYKTLTGSSEAGPACWGCVMHSLTANDEEANGLDCSGLVTWALKNGGFDCGDVGAGGLDYSKNTLFYFGDREDISIDNFNSIQAGDLVHNEKADGHIGIVIGKGNKSIFVAQATWQDGSLFEKPYGVTVTEYSIEEFVEDWNEVMLMDSYYKNSGNYTSMW